MNMKYFLVALIITVLFFTCGCNISFGSSSSENPAISLPENSQILFPDTSSKEDLPSSSEPISSNMPIAEAPPVLYGAQLEGLDFSVMGKEDLAILLQPVLDRAKYFCRFGLIGELDNVEIDYNIDTAIRRPYRKQSEHIYYPYLNLPYRTVEELKQDMCTVFTSTNLDGDLAFIFDGMIDFDGRIYFPSGVSGYSVDRRWEVESMEIVNAEKENLSVIMSVSFGSSKETFLAPLNFELVDGYIVMDESYFAKSDS